MNLIDGLPEELRMTRHDQYPLLYQQTQRLYFVGSTECVQHIAEKMKFPQFINERCCLSLPVAQLNVEIGGVLKPMPIQADIQFLRRPQDNMIVAIAVCASMVCHFDMFEKGVIALMPTVAADVRSNTFTDSSVESHFFYWCEEVVKSRKDIIDEVLADM